MDGGLAFNPLLCKGTAVNPLASASPFQCLVGELFPTLPQPRGAADLAGANDALAGLRIPVADDKVAMRILGVLALVMEGCEPGSAPLGDVLGEFPGWDMKPGVAQGGARCDSPTR